MSISQRLQPFGVSIFSEITELAESNRAINLGQGTPDGDGPGFVKDAARASLEGGTDQYPPSPGVWALRKAIADRYGPLLGRELDPDTEVTVACGCSEALAASFLGLVDPGDEVIVIEPYYDSYPVNVAFAGGTPRFVTLRPPDFRLDLDELSAAFSKRTRAILLNTPHNPTGRVFDDDELGAVATLCHEHDVIALCDEVYEELTFGPPHHRLATFEGMWNRTVTMSSVAKTYSLTGWKLGWTIGPEHLTAGVRAAHQFLTFTTPTPVQHGAVAALAAPAGYYTQLRASYRAKRDLLVDGLVAAGFLPYAPDGTYFVLADHTPFGLPDDRSFCRHMIEKVGVAAIPPSVFYHRPETGSRLVRFAFCKDEETLTEAVDRLGRLRGA